jgi:hypothetical protein
MHFICEEKNHLQVVTVVVVVEVEAETMYSLLEKEFLEIYP